MIKTDAAELWSKVRLTCKFEPVHDSLATSLGSVYPKIHCMPRLVPAALQHSKDGPVAPLFGTSLACLPGNLPFWKGPKHFTTRYPPATTWKCTDYFAERACALCEIVSKARWKSMGKF